MEEEKSLRLWRNKGECDRLAEKCGRANLLVILKPRDIFSFSSEFRNQIDCRFVGHVVQLFFTSCTHKTLNSVQLFVHVQICGTTISRFKSCSPKKKKGLSACVTLSAFSKQLPCSRIIQQPKVLIENHPPRIPDLIPESHP